MLVYRVQNSEGYGMYSNFDAQREVVKLADGSLDSTERHPTPNRDAKMEDAWDGFRAMHSHRIRFGFASIAQVKFWLYETHVRARLKELGFAVYVVSVIDDNALVGDTQVAFVPRPAPGQGDEVDHPGFFFARQLAFLIHPDDIISVLDLTEI